MKTHELKINEVFSSSNFRAEDGFLQSSRWDRLCEGVLIPLGSLFAIFMIMLGVMLIAD